MTTKPIIFSGPMVRAILDGRKTQTRRIIKGANHAPGICFDGIELQWRRAAFSASTGGLLSTAPLPCVHGDRLWLREAWSGAHAFRDTPPSQRLSIGTPDGPILREDVWYWADGNPEFGNYEPPRPSIHMPRWASRITLAVTAVRVQRLQEISEDDAQAEGMCGPLIDPELDRIVNQIGVAPSDAFKALWNSLHGPDAWAANPWVAAISFERVT